jgi:hypothetical protein
MRVVWILLRLLTGVLAAVGCAWMANRYGPWLALVMWAGGIGLLCVAIAFLMHRQTPGKMSAINYLAGLVLAGGVCLGRG